MKVKVGVMGSAGEAASEESGAALRAKAEALGRAIAARGCVTMTGGTTGLPHAAGAAAHAAGGLHVGVSPASDAREHTESPQSVNAKAAGANGPGGLRLSTVY